MLIKKEVTNLAFDKMCVRLAIVRRKRTVRPENNGKKDRLKSQSNIPLMVISAMKNFMTLSGFLDSLLNKSIFNLCQKIFIFPNFFIIKILYI